jgi:SagB-type dehydrogenase family enzyme
MSSFISRIHAHIRASRTVRRGATAPAYAVPTGQHKHYVRMPHIALPDPIPTGMPLEEALRRRVSFDQAISNRPFSAEELGTMLGNSLRARIHKPSRPYPSGGALFPIETYIIGNVLADYQPGIFHYNPTEHSLEHLWNLPEKFSMAKVIRSPVTPLSSMLVIFTAVWERSAKKYGDLAYSHALLEAGHMAQNLLLVSAAMGAQSRPVAGCEDSYVAELLDLEAETEQFVYGILLAPNAKK